MEALYVGDRLLDLVQYFINSKEDMAQNDSPTPIHRASTFMDV